MSDIKLTSFLLLYVIFAILVMFSQIVSLFDSLKELHCLANIYTKTIVEFQYY